ncbi:hypothetical protein FH972_021772 [Carpinus fangiana]|uniref:GH16 domain-containing protein n=1 Tax=Carpinus fangiana TaxID=176857 RepID=A0A5N6KQN2_9ROSI|nr:hypothetical protein FH972_021772 [Carpinus fangiana]
MYFSTTAAVAALALSFTSSAATIAKRSAPAAPSGYTTAFLDDFTGAQNAPPNANDWIITTGTQYVGGPAKWGTGEVETYTSKSTNVKQSGVGGLWIIPTRSSSGQWTSGRVESKRSNFMAPAGKKMIIRAAIRMPIITPANGAGIWPAFWTLGSTFRQNRMGWPGVGEFDIMESVNGGAAGYSTMHCGVNPGGPCNEPNGIGFSRTCPGSSCLGNWHTYSVEVDRSKSPETVTFSIDGQATRQITSAQVNNATVWANTVHVGHFIIFDVAVGGSFPNAVYGSATPKASTVSGQEMRVDYVAVYYSK